MKMLWKIIKRGVVCIGLTSLFSLLVFAQEGLILNPGFEELNERNEPASWSFWPAWDHAAAKWKVETADVHSGKNALKIEQSSETLAIYLWNKKEEVEFNLNAEYKFSAWVKLVDIDGEQGVDIGVNRKGADGNDYNIRSIAQKGSSDWKKLEVTIGKSVRETIQFDPIINVGPGSGYVLIDDISLEPINMEESKAASSIATGKSEDESEDVSTTVPPVDNNYLIWVGIIAAVVIAAGVIALVAVKMIKKSGK